MVSANMPITLVATSPFFRAYFSLFLFPGWNAVSNLLYIDQPAGTGFSFVTNPLGYETNERQIATELWDLIRQFYKLYPKYSTLDLYVFGESYGEKDSMALPVMLLTLHRLTFSLFWFGFL